MPYRTPSTWRLPLPFTLPFVGWFTHLRVRLPCGSAYVYVYTRLPVRGLRCVVTVTALVLHWLRLLPLVGLPLPPDTARLHCRLHIQHTTAFATRFTTCVYGLYSTLHVLWFDHYRLFTCVLCVLPVHTHVHVVRSRCRYGLRFGCYAVGCVPVRCLVWFPAHAVTHFGFYLYHRARSLSHRLLLRLAVVVLRFTHTAFLHHGWLVVHNTTPFTTTLRLPSLVYTHTCRTFVPHTTRSPRTPPRAVTVCHTPAHTRSFVRGLQFFHLPVLVRYCCTHATAHATVRLYLYLRLLHLAGYRRVTTRLVAAFGCVRLRLLRSRCRAHAHLRLVRRSRLLPQLCLTRWFVAVTADAVVTFWLRTGYTATTGYHTFAVHLVLVLRWIAFTFYYYRTVRAFLAYRTAYGLLHTFCIPVWLLRTTATGCTHVATHRYALRLLRCGSYTRFCHALPFAVTHTASTAFTHGSTHRSPHTVCSLRSATYSCLRG